MADKKYRQEAKRRKTQALMDETLANLPEGFEYKPDLSQDQIPDRYGTPESYQGNHQTDYLDYANNEHSGEDNLIYTGQNQVRAGDFIVDIEKIHTRDLIKMRKLLPRDVYKTVKNRKCARIFRQKNKDKRDKLDD